MKSKAENKKPATKRATPAKKRAPAEKPLVPATAAPPESATPMTARPFVPNTQSLAQLREASAGCKGCPLYATGTQTVFGAGHRTAHVMFIGEQPGNDEDLAGEPFVGPAGKLLDRALAEAGIDRNDVYVTNVVKHFKWIPKGKRRIHQKPSAREIAACRPWLDAELTIVKPNIVVCLGATAAQAILDKSFRVTKMRGQVVASDLGPVIATVHPSSILRAPDDESRRREMALFIEDLKAVATYMKRHAA